MRRIGIRELRQYASRYLRRVEAGETLEVTDRGRPVALLVPLRGHGVLERLEVEGRLGRADFDLLELGAPVRLPKGTALPSETLTSLRRDER
jgi:prevent-host-death family protein